MGDAALQLPADAGRWATPSLRRARQQTPGELWAEVFDPGERLTVGEWADAHRELSRKESAEPGNWRTDRVPYLRFPMELLSVSHPAERIVLQWGAQLGKTQTVLNFVGYCIDHEPAPIMLALSTLDTAKRYSRNRIDALVDSTPVLQGKVAARRSRDDANSRLLKDFPGGYLLIVGANSAPALREASIRYLIAEEIDAWEADAGGEGDPISLAIRRTATYRGRRKIVYVSTPKRKGSSRIDRERRRAEQEWRFQVPCPRCGVSQELERSRLRYTPPAVLERRTVEGGDGETEDLPPEIPGTTYECVACQALIPETEKAGMVERGAWVCIRNKGFRSVALHLNALYSTLGFSWGEAAAMQEAAKHDASQLQVLVNTVDAMPYDEPREAPPWEPLYARREDYPLGVVPAGVRFLTAGVDVQADRLEVEVVGWGRLQRSWSVTYRQIVGDIQQPDVWNELDELLAHDWPCVGGGTIPIWLMAVDSSGFTTTVYRWARKHQPPSYGNGHIAVRRPRSVMVVKGQDKWKPLLPPQGASAEERKRGLKVVGVGVSALKAELYRLLRLPAPGPGEADPVGYLRFPMYPPEWFQGLTAEHLEHRNGRDRWILPAGRRNEPLDCRNYARAAALACELDRRQERDWRRLERTLPPGLLADLDRGGNPAGNAAHAGRISAPPTTEPPPATPPPPQPPPPSPAGPRPRSRRLVSNWMRR